MYFPTDEAAPRLLGVITIKAARLAGGEGYLLSLVLLWGILWHSFGTVGDSRPETTKAQRGPSRYASTDRVGFEPTVRY